MGNCDFCDIERNINALRADIERIKEKYSIDRNIGILAATKTVPPERINFAIDKCNISIIGENRVDELLAKYDDIHKELCEIHLIGALQSNKVSKIIDKVDLIHSLDRISLAKEIERVAAIREKKVRCLVEVNTGREEAKSGVMPENFFDFVEEVRKYPHIELAGVMAVSPICDDIEGYCNYFSKTYQLFIDFLQKKQHNISSELILSMGMSGSYEAAIRCGATLIRPGSIIFGDRNYAFAIDKK